MIPMTVVATIFKASGYSTYRSHTLWLHRWWKAKYKWNQIVKLSLEHSGSRRRTHIRLSLCIPGVGDNGSRRARRPFRLIRTAGG